MLWNSYYLLEESAQSQFQRTGCLEMARFTTDETLLRGRLMTRQYCSLYDMLEKGHEAYLLDAREALSRGLAAVPLIVLTAPTSAGSWGLTGTIDTCTHVRNLSRHV